MRAHIANPDSYERVDYMSLDVGRYWQVAIAYTHLDANGVRSEELTQICDFAIVNGSPDLSNLIHLDPEL